ncbi:MAG: T9SS type A sorting domain-containing protein [Bacteroidales bacterium]|nr:T9SS type A sorting domain-containing protein [Bacteroidales bacterium]
MKISNFLIIMTLFISVLNLKAQRITVDGTKFLVGENEIFMNGANTPWNHWNDFGGNYVSTWWDSEFQRIKNAGGNSTRIWISCNGDVGLIISEDGSVTGASSAFWSDLDDLFHLAEKNKIYIKATLISFDHFRNSYIKYQRWRNMVLNDETIASFIDNYVLPLVSRYKNNPYLWAIDVCNEIEWVNQNEECGKISWQRLQYLVARVASAVHDSSEVLVTLGSAAVKWNSPEFEGNFWSDAALKDQFNKDNARLDFYSPHFYGWVVQWFGNFAVDKSPADYGIDDRPCIIGENSAKGVFNNAANPKLVVPASEMFIGAYENGWKGLMPWTSNGVDTNGDLNDFKSGLQAFKNLHPELIDPPLSSGLNQLFDKNDNSILQKVYPNPGKDQFTVILSDYVGVLLELADNSGRTVFQKKAGSNKIVLSPKNLDSGIYFLSARKNGLLETCKLILN